MQNAHSYISYIFDRYNKTSRKSLLLVAVSYVSKRLSCQKKFEKKSEHVGKVITVIITSIIIISIYICVCICM